MQCMNRKKLLTKFLIASLAVRVINFSPVISYENNLQIISVVHAEIRTYEAVGRAEFNFGEDNPQLVEMAKNYARMDAEQNAKEKAGIYLKSFSRTLGGNVTDDDISVVANNSAEIIDVKFKQIPYVSHDVHGNATGEIGIAYEATATVKIDSDALSRYIKHDQSEKYRLIQQNKDSQKNINDINKNIEELKNNPQKATSAEIEKINNKILAQQKLNEGLKLHDQQNYQEAISKYNEAVKLNPNLWGIYLVRGTAYLEFKDYNHAITDYDKAIQIDPNYSNAYVCRGIAYFEMKDYARTVSNFDKALQLDSNNFDGYKWRGLVYENQKNYDKAVEDYTKALQINPNDSKVYCARGAIYIVLKDYNRAMTDLNTAIQINPNDETAYALRGACWMMLGNPSRYLADMNKAKRLGYGKDVEGRKNDSNFVSDDPSVHLKRGDLYGKSKNFDKAIKEYTKAIELDPKYIDAYFNRAIAYALLSDNKKALDDFTKIIQFNPKNAKAYYYRGICNKMMGDQAKAQADFENAKQLFSEEIRLSPNNANAYFYRGLCYKTMGDDSNAKADFAKAKELGYKG